MSSSQSSDPSKPALNIDGRSIWDLDLGMSSLDLTVYASGLPGRKEPVEIGNLSQLSFSSHRDKFPVSSLGRVGMKSYVGGHRTCLAEGQPVITDQGPIPIEQIRPGDQVLSYENDHPQLNTVLQTFDNGIQETISLTLATGHKLRVTPDHEIFTKSGWKPAKDLSVSDLVMIPLDLPDTEDLHIPDYYLKFLAYGLGDGIFGKSSKAGNEAETWFAFTPGHKDLAVVQEIEAECIQNSLGYSKKFDRNTYGIRLRNCKGQTWYQNREYNPFIVWTRGLGIYGQKSHNKRIPKELLAMSKRQTRLFLSRLFTTDGCVTIREDTGCPRFVYTSTSKGLIEDIQFLLCKVGILATVFHNKVTGQSHLYKGRAVISRHDSYTLNFHCVYTYRLLKEIGIFGKESIYEKHLGILKDKETITGLDVFQTMESLGIRYPSRYNLAGLRGTQRFTYYSKKKLLATFGDAINEKQKAGLLAAVRTHGWIEISKIEKSSPCHVYDLEVENAHNFFAPILVHNCGGNLVFSTTDESAWSDLVYPMSRSMARQVHPDEYPPFTIIMTRVNEVGRVSYGALYGVTILDFGTNESVDNLIPMESYSMMALSMSRFTPYESPVPEILRNLGAFAESYNGLMASTVLSESSVKVVK